MAEKPLTFWEHLDELRAVIMRIVVCMTVLAIVFFCLKDLLFDIVLAPSSDDFILYQLIRDWLPNAEMQPIAIQMINTELTGQFMTHMQVAFYVAIVVSAPYILWQIFNYLAPALYSNERHFVRIAMVSGTFLFYVGAAVSYVLIFPLSYRFLALYQVSEIVVNMIDLQSYVGTMAMLCLMMGIMFELPLVAILLGHFGLVTSSMMSQYRRHAILAILIAAAIITPTTDIFTLIIVAMPIYLLYECSIIGVKVLEIKSSKGIKK